MNKKAIGIGICAAFFALAPTVFAGQENTSNTNNSNSSYWSDYWNNYGKSSYNNNSNPVNYTSNNNRSRDISDQNMSASKNGYLFETNLSGNQEIPAAPGTVSGNAGVWFSENGKDMNYWLSAWSEKENLTAAHIHCGDPGENGPAVVTLFHDGGKQTSGEIGRGYLSDGNIENGGTNCDEVIGYEIRNLSDLSRAIREGKTYVNLHSQNYPNGVARGQLGNQGSYSNSNWNNQNWNNQANQNSWWWDSYNYSSSSPWQTSSSSNWSQSSTNSYANAYAQGYVAGANAYANSRAGASAYSNSSSGNWSDQFWRNW